MDNTMNQIQNTTTMKRPKQLPAVDRNANPTAVPAGAKVGPSATDWSKIFGSVGGPQIIAF
jgi:hypothetical protein